jgi:hypothetical protein
MDGDITGADLASAMSGDSPAAVADTATSGATPTETPAATGTGTTDPAAVSATTTDRSTEPKPAGPVPLAVHTKALENARAKERAAAVAELEQQLGWARAVKREDYTQAVELAKRASTDPIGFMREFLADLQAHPQHSQALRSEVARALGGGRGGQRAMPSPNVQITDANGNVIGETYDAAGLAARDAYMFEQWMAKVDEKYAPVVKTHETLAQQQQKALDDAEGEKFASGLMGELKAYPHFETHKDAIGAEVVRIISQYAKDDPRVNSPEFLEAATLRAYHRIVTPTLDQSARQAALHDITTKAQHSGVVPGTSSVAAPKDLKDLPWEEGLRREYARVTAGAR